MRKEIFIFIILLALISKISFAEENDYYLYPYELWASSYLNQNDFILQDNYHPYYLLDNNPKTAWIEGVPGIGINERVVFMNRFVKEEKIICLFRNGYQKSEESFINNNRVKDIQVNLATGTQNNPKKNTYIFTLKDELGWQEIEMIPEDDVWQISFEILSVYEGTKYDNTCISDIKIKQQNVNGINLQQKEKYKRWFEERSNKAGFFQNIPEKYPFIPYKKIKSTKNVSFEKWREKDQCLFDYQYYANVFNDTDLESLGRSDKGKSILEVINRDTYQNKSICTLDFIRASFYRPEIVSEYIYNGMENFYNTSNLRISDCETNSRLKNRWYEIYTNDRKVQKIISNHIGAFEDYQRKFTYEYFYDKEGRLIFIKGDVIGEDGEISNDALLEWGGEKIIKIFGIFVEHGNNGIDISLNKYY